MGLSFLADPIGHHDGDLCVDLGILDETRCGLIVRKILEAGCGKEELSSKARITLPGTATDPKSTSHGRHNRAQESLTLLKNKNTYSRPDL